MYPSTPSRSAKRTQTLVLLSLVLAGIGLAGPAEAQDGTSVLFPPPEFAPTEPVPRAPLLLFEDGGGVFRLLVERSLAVYSDGWVSYSEVRKTPICLLATLVQEGLEDFTLGPCPDPLEHHLTRRLFVGEDVVEAFARDLRALGIGRLHGVQELPNVVVYPTKTITFFRPLRQRPEGRFSGRALANTYSYGIPQGKVGQIQGLIEAFIEDHVLD